MTDELANNARWYRERLVAAHFGTLEDEELARFNHLRANDRDCARLQEAFESRGVVEGEGGHLPGDLIARWGTLKDTLRGAERAAIMSHLTNCSECREDISLLGFSVNIETSGASISSTMMQPTIRIVREMTTSAALWKQRLFAAWAIAATAAVVTIGMRLGPFTAGQVANQTAPRSAAPDHASAPATTPSRMLIAAPIQLRDVSRGSQPDTLVYHVDPGALALQIDVSKLVVPVGEVHEISLMLRDPRGGETRASSMSGSLSVLTVTNGVSAPETGLYELQIVDKDPDGPIQQVIHFRVVH